MRAHLSRALALAGLILFAWIAATATAGAESASARFDHFQTGFPLKADTSTSIARRATSTDGFRARRAAASLAITA
jgi:hypothetical protein